MKFNLVAEPHFGGALPVVTGGGSASAGHAGLPVPTPGPTTTAKEKGEQNKGKQGKKGNSHMNTNNVQAVQAMNFFRPENIPREQPLKQTNNAANTVLDESEYMLIAHIRNQRKNMSKK